jgi:hypothetical protein
MSKLTTSYETKLQTAQRSEVAAILDARLEATSPQEVADYVGLACDNINAQIERIKSAESELKAIRKFAEDQLELIGEGVAEWLYDSGVEKLAGDRVSSISVSERNPSELLVVTDEESLINRGYFKTVLDKTAVKNAVKEGVVDDGAHIERTHLANTVRINKRRSKKTTQED